MTTRRTASPVELARIRTLRAERDRADKAMRDHGKICKRCSDAISMTGDYCPAGWELAQAKAQARYYWARRDDYAKRDGVQDTLF